jgi:hypothetical protein|tara:strand:- start:460 stop:957 length:498 start_codon:yes stop_codon:yes gene_type:complete
MSFTRFDYDNCRVEKKLQEMTGIGRYMLNTPGPGANASFIEDPHIRLQGWGANLRHVDGGAVIDINSDLIGITRHLSKDCTNSKYPYKGAVKSEKNYYPQCKKTITQQSRTTHPAWMYKDLEQNNQYPLFLNPQENVCIPFHNNLNSRLLERDNFVPEIPCLNPQ